MKVIFYHSVLKDFRHAGMDLLLDRLDLPSCGRRGIVHEISQIIALFLMQYSVNNLSDLATLGEHRFFNFSVTLFAFKICF